MSEILPISISSDAKEQLKSIIFFVKLHSLKNAQILNTSILAAIEDLSTCPKKHPPDKFKLDNDGSYRAFEIKNIRISYHVSEKRVIIIRIRNARMNPILF